MPEQSTALLQIHGLSICYGRVEALSDASIAVPSGAVVTVIGPNGAGKSTLLNGIMGLLPSSKGTVRMNGQPLPSRPEQRLTHGMALVPERRELFSAMSVKDNLLLGGYTRHRAGESGWQATLDSVYALFPRLSERGTQQAGSLSGGERQMLALGRALMAKPRMLLLDEPSLGLAPLIVGEIFNVIGRLKSEGISTLLVEQNARAALQAASYAYVLENGRITTEGDAAALASDPRIAESYLGIGASRSAKRADRLAVPSGRTS